MGKRAKARAWRKQNGFLPEKQPDADGKVRSRMSPTAQDAIKERFDAFVGKFGREPGPGDPLFFDPAQDVPVPMEFGADFEAEVMMTMLKIGIDPMIVYSYWKTGRVVTQQNSQLLADSDLAEWLEACEEWEHIESGDLPPPPSLPAFLRPGASA